MLTRTMMAFSALSLLAVPNASQAQRYHGYYSEDGDRGGYDERDYQRQAYYQQQNYYGEQGYYPQQAYGYSNRYYGRTFGYRRHRCSGTTGTIVGAGAGALLGRSMARGSSGTILGAALGALVGRQVGKSTC